MKARPKARPAVYQSSRAGWNGRDYAHQAQRGLRCSPPTRCAESL